MQQLLLTSCLVLFIACATGPTLPPPTTPSPREELPDASLIFLGTVQGNEEGGTARVVIVDQIYYQQGSFADQTAKPLLVEGSSQAPGSQHVFFVNPVQFGERIRALRVDERPAKRYSKSEIAQLVRAKRKQELRARIDDVELMFVGAVATTEPDRRRMFGPVTSWWFAMARGAAARHRILR